MSQPQSGIGFLSLPRELRDKIYVELLDIDRVYDLNGNTYDLQPAILQTNKQIHDEASQVLYEKNCWVMFTVKIPDIRYNHVRSSYVLASSQQDSLEYLRCRAKLHVDITQPIPDPQVARTSFLIPHTELPQAVENMARGLPSIKRQYQIRLNIPRDSPKRRSAVQEALLDPFLDVRGVAYSVVEGVEPSSVGIEVALAMMTPMKYLHEFASRMRIYLARANEKITDRHFLDASRICMYAMMHIVFMLCRPDLSDFNDFKDQNVRAVLERTKGELVSGLALCCIELGVSQPARRMLVEMLQKSAVATLERARFTRRIYFQVQGIHGLSVTFRFGHILSIDPSCEIFNEKDDKLKMGFEFAGINGQFSVSRYPRVRVRDSSHESEDETEDLTRNYLHDYRFGKKMFKPLLARYQS